MTVELLADSVVHKVQAEVRSKPRDRDPRSAARPLTSRPEQRTGEPALPR
ncbi:MAG: hypothetical protein JNK02_02570 [Planctomycetes bacterium]|nr:hypothetical protein [Planctomycetota bacterium]